MHDEISHLRIVDRLACLCLPRSVGLGIIGIDAHDIETAQILKGDTIEVCQLTPENQVQKLLLSPLSRHVFCPSLNWFRTSCDQGCVNAGCGSNEPAS